MPRPPAGLDPQARRWFAELVKLMKEARLLDAADFGIVAAAAVALARAIAAAKEIRARGDYVESRLGEVIANPALRVERESWAAFNRYSEKLGLSPSDRARLAALGVTGKPPAAEVPGLGELRLVK